MDLLRLGGPVMVPLILASIAVLAIIIERAIVLARYRLPTNWRPGTPISSMLAALGDRPEFADFREAMLDKGADEASLTLAGEAVVARMEARLGLLATLAKLSTLMGLLGTIIGMIDAFAVIAHATGGVDLAGLADGLWQALITTATGLTIAIPAYLAGAVFEARVAASARALTTAAHLALQSRKDASEGTP